MHIRCPHCHNTNEVVLGQNYWDVSCTYCGTSFNLVGTDATTTYQQKSKSIAHFELINQIGMGQFGSVWKARDTKLDRLVAVKVPRMGPLDVEDAEMFLREARAAAQLKHPFIVSIHETGRDNGQVYIVSDYVHGVNLKEWLSGKRLSLREAAELCASIADALHHAHESGVVHRDVKPSNIMIDDQGQPHVMDFGLAKRDAGEISITMDGRVIGTPAYMSPEQAAGKSHQADRRADIYSLGVILFELLTGELPFRGDKQMLLLQISNDDPPSPRKLNSRVPQDLETVCLKCLRKESDRRYATAGELSADLRRWLRREPILARPVSRFERSILWCQRRPMIVGSSLAIIAVVMVATGIVAWQRRESDRRRSAAMVETLLSSRPDAVPLAIANLFPFRHHAILRLSSFCDDKSREFEQRLHAAYALAEFGEVKVEFLASAISAAKPAECSNLVSALGHAQDRARSILRDNALVAGQAGDWQYKARLAIVALYLGDESISADMLQIEDRSDPIQRSIFIERFVEWHGDISKLAGIAAEADDAALRSGIVLGVGSITDLDDAARKAWIPVLTHWFINHSDAVTHTATGWTLRQWHVTLPLVAPSRQPIEELEWHVNSMGMTMLRIPAGSFIRKDPDVQDAVEQHVTLTSSLLLADRELSVGLFQQFIDDPNCPQTEKPEKWKGADPAYSPTPDHPVQQVNWNDAVLFCNWLSGKEGLTPFYQRKMEARVVGGIEQLVDGWSLVPDSSAYRLPTEAEWEYACRFGSSTMFGFGGDELLLDRYAVIGKSRTAIGGSRLPNGLGLFDIHGNVWEWCIDEYGPYGQSATVINPLRTAIPTTAQVRGVLRGGSFTYNSLNARSANRLYPERAASNGDYGFRVARTFP